MVDHYSDFIELEEISDLTTGNTVNNFKRVFSTHGISMLVISGNGPNYMSHEFSEFVVLCELEHVSSSPHHYQANGRAEAAVKVAKDLVKKSIQDHTPLWLLLLNQRNTVQVHWFKPCSAPDVATDTYLATGCKTSPERRCGSRCAD